MHHQAREITTSQQAISDKLEALVAKYQVAKNQRPISEHTQRAFDEAKEWLAGHTEPLILDSCCGVGESTAKIANANPNTRVIGLDKSVARLNKHSHYAEERQNYIVVRADVNDFWRLARNAKWVLDKHFLLYPNPYPKPAQVQKRWHASAVMPDLVALGGELEVRSNWSLYLKEFAFALDAYNKASKIIEVNSLGAITTPFERKYIESGQSCWKLMSNLSLK